MSNYRSYYLKSLGLHEDALPGEDPASQVDPNELQVGIETEKEHTQDPEIAKKIAMDHLAEDPHYYSKLKSCGLGDENRPEPSGNNMQMQKLLSPTARSAMVIAVGVRGTKTGLLPAGGIVTDPEKARLGGLELVKNLKPNSQGAIANTPMSDKIASDGGHFTPNNIAISNGKPPVTNVKGDEQIHPFQTQQLGNKPFEDDGTSRDGKVDPPDYEKKDGHPLAGIVNGDHNDMAPCDKEPGINVAEEKPKAPWGIELGEEEDEDEEGEGEDVSIDIKETLKEAKAEVKPAEETKEEPKKEEPVIKEVEETFDMKDRFKKLANIKGNTNEAGALSELKQVVERMQAKGIKSPLLEKAANYLKKK